MHATPRVEMAVRTFGTEHNAFGLEPGDPRLANGALVVIDPDTGMVFDFFVSNDRIRPLCERLPSAQAARHGHVLRPHPEGAHLHSCGKNIVTVNTISPGLTRTAGTMVGRRGRTSRT